MDQGDVTVISSFWRFVASLILVSACFHPAHGCLLWLTGEVGGGNYTYYHLSQAGSFRVQLQSVKGDVDLYVAKDHSLPTYELDTHDLYSATCGEDVVDIPASFKRPVGIGVYGHPAHEKSVFELCFDVAPNKEESEAVWHDFYYGEDEQGSKRESYNEMGRSAQHDAGGAHDSVPHEPSLLWTILIDILKVFVEIFL